MLLSCDDITGWRGLWVSKTEISNKQEERSPSLTRGTSILTVGTGGGGGAGKEGGYRRGRAGVGVIFPISPLSYLY